MPRSFFSPPGFSLLSSSLNSMFLRTLLASNFFPLVLPYPRRHSDSSFKIQSKILISQDLFLSSRLTYLAAKLMSLGEELMDASNTTWLQYNFSLFKISLSQSTTTLKVSSVMYSQRSSTQGLSSNSLLFFIFKWSAYLPKVF